MTDDDGTLMLVAAIVVAAVTIIGWMRSLMDGALVWVIALGLLSLYWTHTVAEMVLVRIFH